MSATDDVPSDFGPVLAYARAVPESARAGCFLTISTFSVVIAVYERCRGLDWWWSLGTALAVFVCLYVANFKVYMRAGEGWFASNHGFVRTDDLSRLRARMILSGTQIALWDRGGRHIDVPLSELAGDPKIWQLVVAGVQVSQTRGLRVDHALTARIFGLTRGRPQPPADAALAIASGSADA